MIRQLSARGFILLQTAGRLADDMGLPAYAVGGLVRDLLRGKSSTDIDIVIEGDGISFAKLLGQELDGRVRAHHAFGTATVTLTDDLALDVATARAETYARPAALPQVVPGSIMQDLFRRDFTVNAMAIRLNAQRFGELIDPFGGQHDLQAKCLRILHARSFVDDPTRLFRAIRFEARLGFRMDRETLTRSAEAERQDLPGRLSGHRLCNELRLMLSEARPDIILARMGTLRLLRSIHPKLAWTQGKARLFQAVHGAAAHCRKTGRVRHLDLWLVHLMVLVDGLSQPALNETLARLDLPARDAERIRTGCGAAAAILRRLARRPPPKPSGIYRLLVGLSDETMCFLITKAGTDAVRRRLVAYLACYRDTKPSLRGADLKALGLKPGPRYKKILTRLLDAKLDGKVRSVNDERKLVAGLVRS